MKISSSAFLKSGCLVAAFGLLASGWTVSAADALRYKATPKGCSMRIDGTANIHKWNMEGSIITGYIEVPAGVVLDSTQAAIAGAPGDGKLDIKSLVRMPVNSILNTEWNGMNEVMQDAMKATDFPNIEYNLTSLTVKQPHAANSPFECTAQGELSLHGVTNKITMPVTIESPDKTHLKVVGAAVPVKMTDYGIKPPVKAAIFTTEDEVKISFTWVVALPKPKAP